MRLGMPFDTYIVAFDTAVWASVIASQCQRRLRSSLYGQAILTESGPLWTGLALLGMATWPALIVLAFLQFSWLTALAWLSAGALSAALITGLSGLYRRDAAQLVVIERLAHALALALAVLLWAQAMTARR